MVHVLKKFGPAVQIEDERVKNVEIEEWFTHKIVPHMEENVSTVET